MNWFIGVIKIKLKSWFKKFIFMECVGLYITVVGAAVVFLMFCVYAYMWNS